MRYFPSKNRYFNLKLKKCKKTSKYFIPLIGESTMKYVLMMNSTKQ